MGSWGVGAGLCLLAATGRLGLGSAWGAALGSWAAGQREMDGAAAAAEEDGQGATSGRSPTGLMRGGVRRAIQGTQGAVQRAKELKSDAAAGVAAKGGGLQKLGRESASAAAKGLQREARGLGKKASAATTKMVMRRGGEEGGGEQGSDALHPTWWMTADLSGEWQVQSDGPVQPPVREVIRLWKLGPATAALGVGEEEERGRCGR
jgi:Zn-dependent protease with chaperone function